MWSDIRVFLALVALRTINALTVTTFFQPDEYFQALEPAWSTAFGARSGAWITWEWHEQLRSSLHPLIFTIVYQLAARLCSLVTLTPRSRAEVLIAAPKILQAVFAACSDFFTFQLARKVYGGGSRSSKATLALSVLSPWQWFFSTRTFSNSLETTLTITALNLWPWSWYEGSRVATKQQNGSVKPRTPSNIADETHSTTVNRLPYALVLAATACILRPTNILVWAMLSVQLLFLTMNTQKLSALLISSVMAGSTMLALHVGLDTAFYGRLTFPPLNFLYFNVAQSLAVFYGTNRLDYYFTEGLGLLLTTALPFAVYGLAKSFTDFWSCTEGQLPREQLIRYLFSSSIMVSLFAHSLMSHKEVRFAYHLLPTLHILAAKPLASFFEPPPFTRKPYRSLLLIMGLAANLVIAYYIAYVHQRGVIDVMHYLRHAYESKADDYSNDFNAMTVGFLMPCHSTPWRSHLVYPEIRAWALTCEPPLKIPLEQRASYLDEADHFYADPIAWMDENMENPKLDPEVEVQCLDDEPRKWPKYLVFFEQLELAMKEVMSGGRLGYEEVWRGFNSHWHDDWRRVGDVIVWRQAAKAER